MLKTTSARKVILSTRRYFVNRWLTLLAETPLDRSDCVVATKDWRPLELGPVSVAVGLDYGSINDPPHLLNDDATY
jgi:hypothetical protein